MVKRMIMGSGEFRNKEIVPMTTIDKKPNKTTIRIKAQNETPAHPHHRLNGPTTIAI